MAFVRQTWDRLSLYLPVMLMGILAMATYWLVRSTPLAEVPAPVVVVQHLPDYFMRQFAVKTFGEDGRLKSEVKGGQAHHFPDTDTLEISHVTIRSLDSQGHLTTATARQAVTNGDASEVTLMGNVQVVRAASRSVAGKEQPGIIFTGEFMHAFMKTERVISDQPVVFTRGADYFTADSMEFDNQHRVLQLSGRVKGVLMPAVQR